MQRERNIATKLSPDASVVTNSELHPRKGPPLWASQEEGSVGPIPLSTNRLILLVAACYCHLIDKELQSSKYQGSSFKLAVLKIKQGLERWLSS